MSPIEFTVDENKATIERLMARLLVGKKLIRYEAFEFESDFFFGDSKESDRLEDLVRLTVRSTFRFEGQEMFSPELQKAVVVKAVGNEPRDHRATLSCMQCFGEDVLSSRLLDEFLEIKFSENVLTISNSFVSAAIDDWDEVPWQISIDPLTCFELASELDGRVAARFPRMFREVGK